MSVSINYLMPLVELVEKSAPKLATLLIGPAGGYVVSLIESYFGIKPNDDPITKIQSDPDHDIKLKQLEDTHSENLQNLQVTLAKVEEEDAASARNRELELAKSGHPSKIMNFIAYFVVGMFFLYMGGVVLKFINNDSVIFNQLANMCTGIIGYYFAKSHKG